VTATPSPGEPGSREAPIPRPAARAILVADRRVLLFSSVADDVPGLLWFMPGGGLERGESSEQALRRELREETGLDDFELGPCVWLRRHVWRWQGRWYDQRERYFLARAGSTEVDASGLESGEMQAIRGFRWWTAAEIAAATSETFVPRALARLLPPLLDGDVPAAPIDSGI